MNLIFVTKKNDEERKILAFNADLFEDVSLSDCYGPDGQLIGDSEAGNYIVLSEQQANQMAKVWDEDENGEQQFSRGQVVSAYDNWQLFDAVKNELGEDCIEGVLVTAYSYHDGHNWQSVVLDYEYGNYEIVSEETSNELLEIYESEDFEFEEDRPFCRSYKTEKFIFTEYNFPGHPELFIVTNNFLR